MKIIFINDRKLAQDLREDKVSNKEKVFYLLFFLIGSQLLGIIFSRLPVFLNHNQNNLRDGIFYWHFILIPIISLLIKGYGIILSYKINSDGDGRNFIERVMCLLFPVSIRIFILLIFIKFLVSLTKEFTANFVSSFDISYLITATDKASTIIVAIYFCVRLKESVKIASAAI